MQTRDLTVSLLSAAVLTLATSAVPTTHVLRCAEVEGGGPCAQVAAGFPFAFIVDHYAISPVNSVGLLNAALGEDIWLWHGFMADVLVWWLAVTAALLSRRARDVRPAGSAPGPRR